MNRKNYKIILLMHKFWAFRFLAFARNDNALLALGSPSYFFNKEELKK